MIKERGNEGCTQHGHILDKATRTVFAHGLKEYKKRFSR
jgi:hypothetical protein